MEIKARYSERSIRQDFIEVLVTPNDAVKIVEVLQSLKKRLKLDRYEEMIVNELINGFFKPDDKLPINEAVKGPVMVHQQPQPVSREIDKLEVVKTLRNMLDPRGEKTVEVFMNESIIFGKNQFGIKTDPRDGTQEAFYDWLLENNIINPDGSPHKKL